MPIKIGGVPSTPTTASWDGVVDAAGDGDYSTIQAGDDDLDASSYTMYVKQGTYAENVVVSTDDVYIFIEAGTDMQGTLTLSGNNISVQMGNGCDSDGLILSGNNLLVDGGGHDTLINGGTAAEAIVATGVDVTVQNLSAQTTGGGGSAYNGIRFGTANGSGAERCTAINCKVIDSDQYGIYLSGVGDHKVIGCTVIESDDIGLIIHAPMCIVSSNKILNGASYGIFCGSLSDNSNVTGNIVKDNSGVSIQIDSAGEDIVVVGNRVDGAITDNSGTSTVASNDATAF